MINFVNNYTSHYDDNMTKEKENYKKIDAGDKQKENPPVLLLKTLKANDCFKLLHMSRKTIKHV